MSQELVTERGVEDARHWARILYVIHALTFFFSLGLLSIVPVIINYVKRPDTAGTIVHSHHTWMIRSFWWFAVWMTVGGVLWVTLILIPLAWLVWFVVCVWKAYRLVRGFLDLNNNRAMPV
jgi:uncharacterized membrane protein